MPIKLDKLEVFRMSPIANLGRIIEHGLYCKNECPVDTTGFISIGNQEIIDRRGSAVVKSFPETVVNDYVPFYFSVRTPMLYNINTGWKVSYYPQENIIYLCFNISDLTSNDFQWCYTDGNAAVAISKFYTDLNTIDKNIDWKSIQTTDFAGKTDTARDTIRKKHAELLIRGHVPSHLIKRVVVHNEEKKTEVERILETHQIARPVNINLKYYF